MKEEFDFVNTFPPLGHPEHHFNKYPNHPWLKSKSDIKEWLKVNCTLEKHKDDDGNVEDYTIEHKFIINDDLTVTVKHKNEKVPLSFKSLEYIRVQFRELNEFDCSHSDLNSLVGSPYNCEKIIATANYITSLDGVSKQLKELDVSRNDLKSLLSMPTFNRDDVVIYLGNNPISSWEGFTNCKVVQYWGYEWNDLVEEDFINIPDSIKSFSVLSYFENSNIELKDGYVDNDWLEAFKTSKKIKDGLKNDINSARKRKL